MELVEEEDDALVGPGDLGLDLRHPLGESAAHPGAREQARGVDLDHDPVVQRHDVAPVGDPLGEPPDDARLAHARGADEARAVRLPLGQHVERAVDLGLAPEHGVELSAGRGEREVSPDGREGREPLRVELEAGPGMAARARRGRRVTALRPRRHDRDRGRLGCRRGRVLLVVIEVVGRATARGAGGPGGRASCVAAGVRRGPTMPIATCIAAVRSLVTSDPHCATARNAAVARSWHSAKRR